MIDQSHNIEGKIEAMIQSVVNIRPRTPRAVVDRAKLRDAQLAGDVLEAHRGYERTRPMCGRFSALRAESDLPPDPVEASIRGHAQRLARERA
jgi:L-rhamnose isomerase/sugar isomerase